MASLSRRPSPPSCRPLVEPLEDRCLLTTFYVAPTGNNQNPGTLDRPFLTIRRGLQAATHPGDVVAVRAGTYREQVTFRTSGTAAGGYITLTAFGNEKPVISGSGLVTTVLVAMNNVSYVKLVGFEIAHINVTVPAGDGSGVRVTGGGSHIEIRNNRIHDLRGHDAMGITVYGTSGVTPVSDLVVSGNEIYDGSPARSEALTLNGNVTGFQVTNNKVHDVNNIGIDLIGGEAGFPVGLVARNGVVRGNVVYNCRANYEGGFGAGIYVDGGKDIVVERNVAHHNDLGIEVGAETAGVVASNITVRNNLIYSNDKGGLVFGGFDGGAGRVKNSRFVNNTVYRNDTLNTGNGQLLIQYASGNVVTNNIFWAASNNVLTGSAVAGNTSNVLDNNLWFAAAGTVAAVFNWNSEEYDSFAEYRAATRQDANSVFANPQFVNTTAADFHLRLGSPAIDRGSATVGRFAPTDFDGRPRPLRLRPDIGAFELP